MNRPGRRERAHGRWLSFLEKARQPRLVRAALRYLITNGPSLSGGVTFSAILSLTAALTILINGARAVIRDDEVAFDTLLQLINQVLPGVFEVGAQTGILDPEALMLPPGFNWATFISVVVLLWSAAMVMTGLRKSMRIVFGLAGAPLHFLYGKLMDLLGFLALGVSVLVSAALVSSVTVGGRRLLVWLGIDNLPTAVALAVVAFLMAAVLDALVVLLLLRLTARVRVPRRDRLHAMVLGAVVFGLLRVAGTSVIGLMDNLLVASVAAVATLVLWVNLAVRALLMISAWTANPPGADVPVHPTTVHASQTPNYVTLSAPHTLQWGHHPVTGTLLPETTGENPPAPQS